MPKGIYKHAKDSKCHNWKGGKPNRKRKEKK